MDRSFERQKGITISNAFQKILHESNGKPNKIRVDNFNFKAVNFTMKAWLMKA